MLEKNIQSTGLDRKYKIPSNKQFIGLIFAQELVFYITIVPFIIMMIGGAVLMKLSDLTLEKALKNKEKLLELGR